MKFVFLFHRSKQRFIEDKANTRFRKTRANPSINQQIRQLVWREIEFGNAKRMALALEVLNRADTDKVHTLPLDRDTVKSNYFLLLTYPLAVLSPFPIHAAVSHTADYTKQKRTASI